MDCLMALNCHTSNRLDSKVCSLDSEVPLGKDFEL